MSPRGIRLMIVLGAFSAGLLLCLGAILMIGGGVSAPAVRQAAAIGGAFRLTDQNGSPVTEQDMKGKPFLVFFGFTHCPDVCPTTLFDVSEVLRKLGPEADRVGALFISVDPARDTPAKLKDYLSSFDPHLKGLTGDEAAITAVAKAYRVYYKKVPLDGGEYTMDHTALVYLMDKEGHFVRPFNIKQRPEEAAADLRKYL
jgi:protein SCO1/2